MAVEIVFIVTDDTTTSQLLAMKFRVLNQNQQIQSHAQVLNLVFWVLNKALLVFGSVHWQTHLLPVQHDLLLADCVYSCGK